MFTTFPCFVCSFAGWKEEREKEESKKCFNEHNFKKDNKRENEQEGERIH